MISSANPLQDVEISEAVARGDGERARVHVIRPSEVAEIGEPEVVTALEDPAPGTGPHLEPRAESESIVGVVQDVQALGGVLAPGGLESLGGFEADEWTTEQNRA